MQIHPVDLAAKSGTAPLEYSSIELPSVRHFAICDQTSWGLNLALLPPDMVVFASVRCLSTVADAVIATLS